MCSVCMRASMQGKVKKTFFFSSREVDEYNNLRVRQQIVMATKEELYPEEWVNRGIGRKCRTGKDLDHPD